jgi:transglutaminase-like putative cysteine protease
MTDPSPRRPVVRVPAGSWQPTLAAWLVFVAALASLHPLFVGSGWWFAAASVSAAVLGAALAARRLRAPSWIAWLVGAASGSALTCAFVSGGTAVLGVIPTSATVQRMRDLADQAEAAIVDESAPLDVSDGILATVLVSVLVASIVIDLVSSVGRLPAFSGIVAVVVLAVPAFVPGVDTSWPSVALAVLLFLVLLALATGRRPTVGGLVGGVAAVAVAGVLTATVPLGGVAPLSGAGGTGLGLATGVNPIVDLGDDLRRGAPVTVLTYRSSDADGDYLKLVDLVDFSGRSWSPAEGDPEPEASLGRLPAAPGIAEGTDRREVTTEIDVGSLRSPYLPLPVPATSVEGVDDEWQVVDDSGVTVRSTSAGTQGLQYTVESAPVDPSREQVVASLAGESAAMADYLATDGVPQSVVDLAAEVTADTPNAFDAAVALQGFFRDGDFTYSEDTPVDEGYDGSGLDAVQTFLEARSGYCVHFASAMAVMARTLGIPSRVAVGFLPGESTGFGADAERRVSSDDLHTWPELYFEGLGWVPFEPTVGLGSPQSYLRPTGVEPTSAPSADDAATPTPSADDAPVESATPTPSTDASDPTASGSASGSTGRGLETTGLLVLALLAGVLIVPSALRAGRRRRRRSVPTPDVALAAWREVVDTGADLGLPAPPGATPTATAASLAERLARGSGAEEARLALDRLVTTLQAERFGGVAAGESAWSDAGLVISALRSSSTPRERLVARLAPRSLIAPSSAGIGMTA